MIRTGLSLALCLAAVPATAQQSFELPQGCEAYVTVQTAACTVEHHFTCEGDPDGFRRRASLDEDGLTFLGQIDGEAQWIASFHALAGVLEELMPDPADPASMSDLLGKGLDTYDFRTTSPQTGETRYVGQDRLTGRSIEIDGVPLEETEYRITAFDAEGTEIWRSSGNEFVHRDWRRFFSGTGATITPEGRIEHDDKPVEFIFPGEPGFLSPRPKHGCGVAIS